MINFSIVYNKNKRHFDFYDYDNGTIFARFIIKNNKEVFASDLYQIWLYGNLKNIIYKLGYTNDEDNISRKNHPVSIIKNYNKKISRIRKLKKI
jgi:hypothetical protein